MHGLELGSLDLVDPIDIDGYTIRVLAEGTTFGSPEVVVRSIVSMLADGNQVKYDRAGNRVVSFPVEIAGADGVALAMGEAALRRELYRPNTVTWTPPSDFGPATAFDVLTSHMEPNFDDLDELRSRRVFQVSLTCAPHARSANITVAEPLSVGGSPVVTVFDTCDTATGWSATVDGAPETATTFWEAGSVGVAIFDNPDGDADTVVLTRAGSVDFTGAPYLVVEARIEGPNTNLIVAADGVALPLLSFRDLGDDHHEYTFLTDGTPTSTLTFTHTRPAANAWLGLLVYDLTKSNMPPGATGRQLSRIIPTGGTERTPASLHLSDPSGADPLRLSLVATWPEDGSGFSPPLRRWRTSGNTETVNTDTYSGKTEPIGPLFVQHDIPIGSLPDGGYQLMALMRTPTPGAHSVEATIQSVHEGVVLGEQTWAETVNFPIANDWTLVPMGTYRLPIVGMKSGFFRIAFRTPGSSDVTYDEAWLFKVDDDCSLSIALCTTPNLWLDSPDSASPVPRIWQGDEADRSDARFPLLYTMGSHIFTPPHMAVFTASGVDWADVTLSYHKRWHSNAAEDG